MKTAVFVRKPSNLKDLIYAADRGAPSPYVIDERLVMNEDAFNDFSKNLINDHYFLAGKGGDVKVDGRFARKCISIECNSTGRQLVVDPQGYDYARYAAVVI